VEDEAERVVFDTAGEVFPALHGKEQYRTRGFKELALCYGVVEQSYRKTVMLINRVRHQAGATRASTLQEVAQAEGTAVQQAVAAKVEQVFEQRASAGLSLEPEEGSALPEARIAPEHVAAALERVTGKMDLTDTQRQAMQDNPVPYEDPASSVAVSIDDVGVKEQKAQRGRDKDGQRQSGRRPTVQTTVAHIQHGRASYIVSGHGVSTVLRLLQGFLLGNRLLGGSLVVFADGQRSLHAAVCLAWQATGRLQIILDWYHLKKKCGEQLSLALNQRDARNQVWETVSHWLWYGLVDEAIATLRGIDPARIKNPAALTALIESLERNRSIIPCYALRRELGLRNSSNAGEKSNDLVVSNRQKHNGMSWSAYGSGALAALATLVQNDEHQAWFRTRQIRFSLAA
jgi:hypothetical protein